MEVIICADADHVGAIAAARIGHIVAERGPDSVLGVATGSSPLGAYRALQARVHSGSLDLSRAHAFALDEYVGLPASHPQSYAEVIRETVTEPLRLLPTHVHVPDGAAVDVEAACAEYEAQMHAVGGIDVQLLGVGSNGHIGFNEPTSSLSSRTRIKTLTERTRLDNQRFFASLAEVPQHCITQGLGTIMDARQVILVAHGRAKAKAIAGVVEGPVTAMCPGSVLQLHQRATIIIDEDAAAELQLREYFRDIYRHKPTLPSGR